MAILDELTRPDVEGADPPLLLVPVGSVEQHGPHLPLGTDTIVAVALAQAIARSRSDAVLAPPLGFGASGEHQGFSGTISIGTDVLASVLTEIIRSARSWCRGVVIVSGHGGNAVALGRASRRGETEGDQVLVVAASVPGADAHAGRTETSLLLALAPGLVRENEAVPGATQPLSEIFETLQRDGVRAVSPNGVLGDPTGASADEGAVIFAEMAARATDAVSERFPR